jgi:threonylcarbamoyladenosine tRNA methylthiotransferase MtaB
VTAPVFSTFGCRLNAWESEAMKTLAARAGVQDAVVVNTCAVTAEAVRKARQEIRKLRRAQPVREADRGDRLRRPDGARDVPAMAEVDLSSATPKSCRPAHGRASPPISSGTPKRCRSTTSCP